MDNSIPPCNIRIDRNGVWYYQGTEMIRQDIVEMFYSNLETDDEGRYLIRMGKQVCVLEVEDTPWIVKEVNPAAGPDENPSSFQIRMSDNSVEELNPEELWMSKENVLYCRVKGGRFRARFSRPAYYEFSKHIQYDERADQFFVKAGNRTYTILRNIKTG
jgi:hypothetical protein